LVEGVLRSVGLRYIHDTVYVKGNLLGGSTPVLVAEAVDVFAVMLGFEGEVAVGGGLFKDFVLADGVGNLF